MTADMENCSGTSSTAMICVQQGTHCLPNMTSGTWMIDNHVLRLLYTDRYVPVHETRMPKHVRGTKP